jgi:hypothetical protein
MNPTKPTRLFVTAASLLVCFTTGAFAQPAFDTALKNLRFRSIGPATMGGRIDDIAVVESDPRIIYIGAAGGGHCDRAFEPIHRVRRDGRGQ